jgi:hypothetical protein
MHELSQHDKKGKKIEDQKLTCLSEILGFAPASSKYLIQSAKPRIVATTKGVFGLA